MQEKEQQHGPLQEPARGERFVQRRQEFGEHEDVDGMLTRCNFFFDKKAGGQGVGASRALADKPLLWRDIFLCELIFLKHRATCAEIIWPVRNILQLLSAEVYD